MVPAERALAARVSAAARSRTRPNTFPSGIGRELASDYHCFVAELGFLAAVETEASGYPLQRRRLAAAVRDADSAAALVDERLRPPRQGDSDEGCALLLDAPNLTGGHRCWHSPMGWSAGSTGGRDRPRMLGSLDRRRAGPAPGTGSRVGRSAPLAIRGRGNDVAAHDRRATRSGADATAARTSTEASPRMRTPTPCRWRFATQASTS